MKTRCIDIYKHVSGGFQKQYLCKILSTYIQSLRFEFENIQLVSGVFFRHGFQGQLIYKYYNSITPFPPSAEAVRFKILECKIID